MSKLDLSSHSAERKPRALLSVPVFPSLRQNFSVTIRVNKQTLWH